MSPTVQEILKELEQLSRQEQELILDSLSNDEVDPDLHPHWIPEINRRVEEIKSGKVQGIPAEEVAEEMKQILY